MFMLKKYSVELEGQIEFYEQYLKIVNPELTYDEIFRNNTDGILNGNLLEFKLNITDLNACLFQTIKYLSSMRIKGEPIPANILLVSLNTGSLSEWINTGYWNEDAFISELTRKYGDSEIQPWELFLWKNFWDLDKQDIDKGFSEVVEKAYSGDLSCEQIISFLTKVQMLQSVKIPFPCEVDPSKMVKGLNERFLRVITEKTEEYERYSVVEIENIAPEWKELYNTAMRFKNRVIMNKQKKRFIAYLDNGLYNEKIAISKMCFESFDSEMLKTFKKSYAQSNNAKKRKIAELLLGLCFDNQEFSTSEDMAVTKKNFCDLSEWLSLQETDDEITSYINKSFIEKIGELNIMK